MNTNTQNLEAASLFWQKQAIAAESWPTYVVATPNGTHVLADNMAVMLAGAALPENFTHRLTATIHCSKLNREGWSFDGTPLRVMLLKDFVAMQIARFEAALTAVKVADVMARQNAVAA